MWLLNQLKVFAGLNECLCPCFIHPSHRNFWSVAELWLSWTRWLKFSPSHTIPTSCTSLKPATTLKVSCTCGLENGSRFIMFLTCHLSSAASVSSLEVIKHLLHCSRVLWRCSCVYRMVIRIYKYLAQKSCFLCSCYRWDFCRAVCFLLQRTCIFTGRLIIHTNSSKMHNFSFLRDLEVLSKLSC